MGALRATNSGSNTRDSHTPEEPKQGSCERGSEGGVPGYYKMGKGLESNSQACDLPICLAAKRTVRESNKDDLHTCRNCG